MKTSGMILTLALLFGAGAFAQDAPTTHTIGEKFGGGTVFYVTQSGQHGLVVESTDHSMGDDLSKDGGNPLNLLGDPGLLSDEAKDFTDWRFPTYGELKLVYKSAKTLGGFQDKSYASYNWLVHLVILNLEVQLNGFNSFSSDGINFKDGKGDVPFATIQLYRLVRSF